MLAIVYKHQQYRSPFICVDMSDFLPNFTTAAVTSYMLYDREMKVIYAQQNPSLYDKDHSYWVIYNCV